VKLLLDQNLSRRLVGLLASDFPDTTHVVECGLETSTDRDVWDYAQQHGYVIASKDSDFRQFAFLYGAPPKVIWVRTGNVTTTAIAELLLASSSRIEAFAAAAEESLLVLPLSLVEASAERPRR
jgi:predicted nuclease of predicted toxin-antitoxin system